MIRSRAIKWVPKLQTSVQTSDYACACNRSCPQARGKSSHGLCVFPRRRPSNRGLFGGAEAPRTGSSLSHRIPLRICGTRWLHLKLGSKKQAWRPLVCHCLQN